MEARNAAWKLTVSGGLHPGIRVAGMSACPTQKLEQPVVVGPWIGLRGANAHHHKVH